MTTRRNIVVGTAVACNDPATCVSGCRGTIANGPCAGAFAAAVLCWSGLSQGQFYCNAQNYPESDNDLCAFAEGLYVLCMANP